MIKINIEYTLLNEDVSKYQEQVTKLHNELENKTGKGNDFLGWLDWPNNYDKEEFARVVEVASEIRENAEVLLVCGIGGSYLGARSAIEMMKGLYANDKVEIIYVGNTFSSTYLKQIVDYVKDKSIYLNVISKSGTTTETSIAFRILKNLVEEKYGNEASTRIIATTDKARGTLKNLATKKGYRTFVIPDDIGGRYSVFTAVGLLPIAVSGINISDLIAGATKAMEDFKNPNIEENVAYKYAVLRRMMENQGKCAEMLVTYDLSMTMVSEWWKQLFGESEGKEGKGLLPMAATFSTDLHSVGQFVQEGTKLMFETLLLVEKPQEDIIFPKDDEDLDNMNYLAGKSVDWVNKMACLGTIEAHVEQGNVPNIVLTLEDNSAYSYGYMIYFFFKSCAMTCYLLEINPFNQPGVEVYKKNMFRLLGKE